MEMKESRRARSGWWSKERVSLGNISVSAAKACSESEKVRSACSELRMTTVGSKGIEDDSGDSCVVGGIVSGETLAPPADSAHCLGS